MKYIKLSLSVCFVFLVLFLVSTLSYAAGASCSPEQGKTGNPSCDSNESCFSSGYIGSTQTGYCAIDYNNNNKASSNSTSSTTSAAGSADTGACLVQHGSNSQICSVTVADSGGNGNVNLTACQSLAGSSINSDLRSGVTGTGPMNNPDGSIGTLTTNYNSTDYATLDAARQLASCLGGSVALTSVQSVDSPFKIPATYDIVLPNGQRGNAGQLIQQLVVSHSGDVNGWINAYVNPYLKTTDYLGNSGNTTSSGTKTTGSPSLNVSSSSSSAGSSASASSQSSASQAMAAINAQVKQAQEKYINAISQIVNTVGSTVPSCGATLCPDLQRLIDLQTQLYQTGSGYAKPIFTTNASAVMRVGDIWNVTITGLNSGETIYAIGGKKVNGVVPTDKTPYTANGLGVFFQTGTHTKDVIGDWQIVWSRADGTALGTMIFSVIDKTAVSNSGASGVISFSTNSNSYCVYSKGEHVNDTAIYTVQGVTGNLANQKIVWSSTKNGVSTGESNAYYNQNFDSKAYWSGSASAPWSLSDIGSWTKTASAFDGTNIVSISQPFAFTVKDCSTGSVGIKTSNFSYTVTKVANGWRVTLDNAALGTPADFFYIPANASITATGAMNLNTQAQARYNTMSYFPGTPTGNSFYQNIFGTFIAVYYDWNNQIAKASSNCGSTATCGQTTPDPVAVPDFSFAVSPQTDTPQNIYKNPLDDSGQASSVAYTLTIAPQNGYKGTIAIQMLNPLQGVTGGIMSGDSSNPYLFTKTFTFTSSQPQSVQFLVAALPNTPTGLYTARIVANAGTPNLQPSHLVMMQVNVQ